ncbi:MAG: hypothetical protein JW862_10400 [Anaerolineales bacterium]|nr:hypothetical protein [Anaerolineales bacterium]
MWLLLMLGPLLFLQRALHREIQSIFLLLFRRMDVALVLFALLFFPGVLLHEGSHYLMALILRVPTGRFSLIPQRLGDGRVRMGYVETGQTDYLRDALIGVAPLLSGGVFVAYVGLVRWQLQNIWVAFHQAGWSGILETLVATTQKADFWLWFYLMLAISSTMLPSVSDRRAWLPVLLILIGLGVLALILGAGDWMRLYLAPRLNDGLRAMAVIFAISAAVHLLAWLPLTLLHRAWARLIGLQVVSA